jgi:hypothetical protein
MKTSIALLLAGLLSASCEPVYADDFYKGIVVGAAGAMVVDTILDHQNERRTVYHDDYYSNRSYDRPNHYDRQYSRETHRMHERVEDSQEHFNTRSKHD